MEFLEVPFFDDDVYKMLVRLTINSVFVALIVGFAYHATQRNRIYVFTFLMMNLMVFFICFSMKKLDLGLGMALGLFAIFAIIRYRTDSIQVKEMTYLFIVIGIAAINALSNRKTSYTELLFANTVIFVATLLLERFSFTTKRLKQNIVYDKLELLKPHNRTELITDIRERTGLDAFDILISKIDLKRGVGTISVYYRSETPDVERHDGDPTEYGSKQQNGS